VIIKLSNNFLPTDIIRLVEHVIILSTQYAVKKDSFFFRFQTLNNKATMVGSKHDKVKASIMKQLADELSVFGKEDLPKKDLVGLVGYKHENTKAFAHALKELKKEGLVTLSSGFVCLTAKGKDQIPQDTTPPAQDNEGARDRFFKILAKKVSQMVKLKEIWTILADGKPHKVDDIVSALGYTHTNTKGFAVPKAALKKMDLIEDAGKGSIRLTDKALPFGRP